MCNSNVYESFTEMYVFFKYVMICLVHQFDMLMNTILLQFCI